MGDFDRKRIFLVLFLLFGILLVSNDVSAAFEFNLTVKYQNGSSVMNGTLNLYQYNVTVGGPPTLVATSTNGMNATGFVNLSNLDNASTVMYQIEILGKNSSGTITHVGPVLQEFPAEMIEGISGSELFVEEAVGFNITVNNGTLGSFFGRGYDILDGEYGNHLSFSDNETQIGDKINDTLYLPLNGSYSFSLFPNATAPLSINYGASGTNLGTDCDLNSSSATLGTVYDCEINGTVELVQFSGYVNASGVAISFDNFTGINYMVESNRVYSNGAFRDVGNFSMPGFHGQRDHFNTSTGFFNVSLPATTTGFETMVLFFATNDSINYGGMYNLTTTVSDSDVSSNISLVPFYGSQGNFSVNSFGGDEGDEGAFSVITNLTILNVTQGAMVGDPSGDSSFSGFFSEIEVTYPSGKVITWSFDPDSGSEIKIPLLNGSSIETNIFASGQSPKRITANSARLASTPIFNITLRSFERSHSEGGTIDMGSFKIEMFYHNSTCNVPTPVSGCSLFNFDDMSDQNMGKEVFKMMLLGKANVKMTDTVSGTSVMYVGVDLMHSNAPPADFGDGADENSTSGSSFDELWKFGSSGPEIYDSVFAIFKYSDSELNDSNSVNLSIDSLYDTTSGDSWDPLWNSSVNTSAQAQNVSQYSAEFNEWEYLLNGTACHSNVENTNVTNPCSMSTSSNEIYIRIPHFSGTGLSVNGVAVESASGGTGGTSTDTGDVTPSEETETGEEEDVSEEGEGEDETAESGEESLIEEIVSEQKSLIKLRKYYILQSLVFVAQGFITFFMLRWYNSLPSHLRRKKMFKVTKPV